MAKQESFVKFRGKVGDLSFIKHRSRGYEVRQKSGVDKRRIMNDPEFQRTRENMTEFGAAASKAKQLRMQLNNITRNVADKEMRNRLTSLTHRVLKLDNESSRGQRVFRDENSGLFRGFEFNAYSSLKMLFAQDLEPSYGRSTGEVSLNIASFNPQNEVLLLEGATHIQFVLAAARLGTGEVLPRPEVTRSEHIPLIGQYPGTTLELNLEPDLTEVVYLMVGIYMYQEVNDGSYSLNNKLFNALTIVDVDIP